MHPISRLRRASVRAAALGSALIFVAATASCGSSDNASDGVAAQQAGNCTEKFKVAVAEDDVRRAAYHAIENKKSTPRRCRIWRSPTWRSQH